MFGLPRELRRLAGRGRKPAKGARDPRAGRGARTRPLRADAAALARAWCVRSHPGDGSETSAPATWAAASADQAGKGVRVFAAGGKVLATDYSAPEYFKAAPAHQSR